MAKTDKKDLLDRWRQAEEKYRTAAQAVFDGAGVGLDKATVVEVTKVRVKADKRMQEFFSDALS
jgi:hypothetical protein